VTESELLEEAKQLAQADKDEIAKRHHALYPADRASIRGAYNPPKHQMLADLIADLATRYKGNP
jgi:hypothetical protein